VSIASGFILGVDLDGVCGDYTGALRDIAVERTGADPASLPLERSWNFDEWGLSEEQFAELHRAAVVEHRMFRTMPPIPGAAETLWRLSDAGIWIRIITHRLYLNWGHALAVADTVDWLDAVGIPYRDLCFLGAKPQVEADCYVEDAPHNVLALRETGAQVIVFDQPYNRHVAGPRAVDWGEVENLVGAQVAGAGLILQAPLPGMEDAANRLRRVRPETG
jgi:beta-phosphoglucomutase-like phosphatase (HAD superfamily)